MMGEPQKTIISKPLSRTDRATWSIEHIQDHIQSLSRTHFDPNVVGTFLTIQDKKC